MPMLRLARLDAPGVLHHVIIREIERKKIFRDKADYDNFFRPAVPAHTGITNSFSRSRLETCRSVA